MNLWHPRTAAFRSVFTSVIRTEQKEAEPILDSERVKKALDVAGRLERWNSIQNDDIKVFRNVYFIPMDMPHGIMDKQGKKILREFQKYSDKSSTTEKIVEETDRMLFFGERTAHESKFEFTYPKLTVFTSSLPGTDMLILKTASPLFLSTDPPEWKAKIKEVAKHAACRGVEFILLGDFGFSVSWEMLENSERMKVFVERLYKETSISSDF